jgi:hypothetical protein
MRRTGKIVSAVAAMVMAAGLTLAAGSPAAQAADPKPANCQDGQQIGSTATVKWRGLTVASVKQYYSARCRANWSYVYIWESFRNRGYGWSVLAQIDVKTDSKSYGLVDRYHWVHTYSTPVNTANLCTSAVASINIFSAPDETGWYMGFVDGATGWRPTGC